jgi:hypothetical protein
MKHDPTLLGPADQLDLTALGLAAESDLVAPPDPTIFFDKKTQKTTFSSATASDLAALFD